VTPWGSGGSGAGRRRFPVDQRTLIIVAVAVVLGVVIAASHRISSSQLIYFLVLVPSIIIHEISHGAVALAFGDSTAKPVPVNAANLRSPRNHIVFVSLVGPFINFVLAAVLGVVFVATGGRTALHEVYLLTQLSLFDQILVLGGFANIMLGVFNLIPCPPLDGAAILERLLPARLLPGYWNLQPFLMFLPFLLILVFRGAWSDLVNHLYSRWVTTLAG